MDIPELPKPGHDTGIGFHWFPDTAHYDKAWLKRFGPELKALGTTWLVIWGSLDAPVPEAFVKGLLEREIEPILRVHTPFVGPVDRSALSHIASEYARCGGHYVYLFSRPNSRASWIQWDADSLPARFADLLAPAIDTLAEVDGLVPLISPLAAPGDWSDLSFLRALLEALVQRGSSGVLDRAGVAIHNLAGNKPLTWGLGGRSAWPDTPLFTGVDGSEDHIGFRLFEWYDEVVGATLGRRLPMIAVESGALMGDAARASYPRVNAQLHAERNSDIAKLMMNGQMPDRLLACAFWVLSAEDSDAAAPQRWFRPDGKAQFPTTVSAIEALPKRVRATLQVAAEIDVLMDDGKIARLPMQQYLKGVVPAEVPASVPLEALKAQAIAARTYAARAVISPRHGKTAVCSAPHCQGWTPKHYPRTDQAVDDTEDTVITSEGRLIGAFYFGHCDGHTRNSEDVWKFKVPYCRSVPCQCGNSLLYGHGVGMCQEGAISMARQGATAQEILQHYYSGTSVLRT